MALNKVNRILVTRPFLASSSRTVVSKALREKIEKPAPYPYLKKDYYYISQLFDRTTPRLDENSKLICVEGAHCVGKTELAKQLAEEFEMEYIGPPDFDDLYIDSHGFDYRKYNDMYPDFFKVFEHKDFIKNPLGGPDGCVERYMYWNYFLKWLNNVKAIRHILNTGQGVVLDSSCAQSDYIHFDAAHRAGFLKPEMRELYYAVRQNTLCELFRPNLILYLDAPVDVVQRNIKASGNENDKNSPVFNNTQYLQSIYNEYKTNFLRDIQEHSRVLVYDWSEGGDLEVVVEDMENVELDMIELYSDQQRDWRFHDEPGASLRRWMFTNSSQIKKKVKTFQVRELFYTTLLSCSHEDNSAMRDIHRHILAYRYRHGANKAMGDDMTMVNLFGFTPGTYERFASFKAMRPYVTKDIGFEDYEYQGGKGGLA